ncbi:MAG: hypothetical protein L0Z62_07485, partial [Gemmataceae bacterium]|nr:hypothetical protein [Gemmataceae bacterium]
MKPTVRLTVEQLEDRCVPATWGNPWADPGHLTVSFAPDGTPVGNLPSELYRELNALAPTHRWQTDMLRALQTWAVHANINIGLVGDSGAAFGTPGLPQGDPRFGDIRLAAYPMLGAEMAIASPYDPTAGTWGGDIKLNSAGTFSLGGAGGR